MCLDAAYHFKSRRLWLEQVLKSGLKEGGTVVWTDILSAEEGEQGEGFEVVASTSRPSSPFPPSGLPRFLLHWIILPLLSVPSRNIVPISYLGASLVELGYEDIEIEDISEDVFPGFAKFLGEREELSWRVMSRLVRWWSGGSTGGRRLLRFVVVRARKGGMIK